MAERRMFAKTIIDSDAFLDMPLSTQALYFHLAMRADDEGFVSNPKKIQKMIGASDDDCKLLILKRYILTFESGIVVIKHWKIHNYIQSDRFKETTYLEEKAMLCLDGKKAYTECIQNGYNSDTQVSIGKDSIGKVRIGQEESKKEREIYQEKNSNHTRENPVVSHKDIMREYNLSDMVCESLEGFLRHCYLNKHIVSNEKLEDIIFRLVDCFNDDKSRIECIERAVRGGYFDIKA